MTTTIQIRPKGQVTIPAEIREKLGIEENGYLTIALWGKKALLMFPKKLTTLEIVRETSALAKKKGITLEELLAELDEIRHKA